MDSQASFQYLCINIYHYIHGLSYVSFGKARVNLCIVCKTFVKVVSTFELCSFITRIF